MIRSIATLAYTLFMSVALCAVEESQKLEPKFLPIFEGESTELGKVTLMSTVHYEPDPYTFEKEVFDSFTSLMIEHDCGQDQEEGDRNLVEWSKSYELVSLKKGFWGDWFHSLPLSELQRANLRQLLDDYTSIFRNWFEISECEFSQIHPLVFKELWHYEIHQKARTLRTFVETIDGRILRDEQSHNKRVAFLESREFAFDESYGPTLKHFTGIMRDPDKNLEVLASLESLNHSIEEKIQEYREGIAGMYRSLFSQDWMEKRDPTLDGRDEAFTSSIIKEMRFFGNITNLFATFGAFHTRGVIKRLQKEGLAFVQLKDDGSRVIIEQLID